MARTPTPPPPAPRSLAALERAEHECERCELHEISRAVPGAGSRSARIMLVGEQPGDQEERAGEPFVGPAGRLLDELLAEAGIDRDDVFVTNAVKRFRHHEKVLAGGGVKRIHDKPTVRQQRACGAWLDAELELVEPEVVVALGATAAQALLGKGTTLREVQGSVASRNDGLRVVASPHPSAALRAPDSARRAELRRQLLDALRLAVRTAADRSVGATGR